MNLSKSCSYLTLSLFLAACGGGGSGTDGSTPQPTMPPATQPPTTPQEPEQNWLVLIEEDPLVKTKQQLREIYSGAAEARYQGSSLLADISPEAVQAFFNVHQGDRRYTIYNLGFDSGDAESLYFDQNTQTIERSVSCYIDGFVDVLGQQSGGETKLALQYNQCEKNAFSGQLSGKGALIVEDLDLGENSWFYDPNSVQYFNSLTFNHYQTALEMTGFYTYSVNLAEAVESGFSNEVKVLITETGSGNQFLQDWSYSWQRTSEGDFSSLSGSIRIDDLGRVNIQDNSQPRESLGAAYRNLTFTGQGGAIAKLNYLQGTLEFLLDLDGDGVSEEGLYVHKSPFQDHDFSENPTVPIAQMNRPPIVNTPRYLSSHYDDEDIEYRLSYQDLDTAEEDLSVSVFWSINYEPLTDFNELTLPSEYISAGDVVSFYYEVFDGTNRVRSQTVDTTIFARPIEQ